MPSVSPSSLLDCPPARRLTLVIPTMGFGGAERVMAFLANHWAVRGDSVTLLTLDNVDQDTYALIPAVRRVALGVMCESRSRWQSVRNNLRRWRRLRHAIRASHPDAVISFTDRMNVLTLLACVGLDLSVVISERADPSHHEIGPGWSHLRRLAYPRCHALVAQTARSGEFLRPFVKGRPIHIIPNAVAPPSHDAPRRDHSPADRRRVVGMGRLEPEKGFELLIEAFAQLAPRHPQWDLEILGEGSLRRSLELEIEQRRLADRIRLRGWVPASTHVLQRTDLFVLPSLHEGFPNALLEAMACGLPVVSAACDSGPGEIVRHEIDGLLVPSRDVAALASAMDRLMADGRLRQSFGRRAAEVVQRFSAERFFGQWDEVLVSIRVQ